MTDVPVPIEPAPVEVVVPWQARLETLGGLLLVLVAAMVVASLVGAYSQLHQIRAFPDENPDVLEITTRAAQTLGIAAAGAVLVAYLLVTLGPDDRIGQRGVLVLRSTVVVGFMTAGVGAVGALGLVISDRNTVNGGADTFLHRLADAVPLGAAALLAVAVAWCAFATLGETSPPPALFDEPDLAG